MIVVDTNVLVYAADRNSEFHSQCRAYLRGLMTDASPSYVTWSICYEFLRVVTHSRVFKKPWSATESWRFIDALLRADSFSTLVPTGRHAGLLAQTLRECPDVRGNLVHDLHTAVLMREHGIHQICTRDTDFQRFPFLTCIDPMRLAVD